MKRPILEEGMSIGLNGLKEEKHKELYEIAFEYAAGWVLLIGEEKRKQLAKELELPILQ